VTQSPWGQPPATDSGAPFGSLRSDLVRSLRIAVADPLRAPALVAARFADTWRARHDRAVVASILSRLPREGDAREAWHIVRVLRPRRHRTGVTIFLVGPAGRPRLAIKVPHTVAGTASLRRLQAVETELHGDARLSDWNAVVPRALAEGRIGGRRYFIETVVPGSVASSTGTGREVLLARQANAAAAIGEFHRLTAERVRVDRLMLERWVDRPVRILSRANLEVDDRDTSAILQSLRRRLIAEIDGREMQVSWIHGDYWRGNLLFGADGMTPTGIVDWDRAGPAELPWHDLFHLLMYARREVNGHLAPEIIALLRGRSIWQEEESAILEMARRRLPDDGIADDVMALLYWLRQTAATMTLHPRSLCDREYLSSDVEPILRAVAELPRG
jgi:aminoglycoside phosphotransferase (APT) family kinase protein